MARVNFNINKNFMICSRRIAQNMNEKFEKFCPEVYIVCRVHINNRKSDFEKFVYRGVKEGISTYV